ncbi:UL16-binding protein 1-like [Apodemus sylvaticus]|uniref:UL16-binding protein 1-like n=1 Tax=Apodemus sylvaticus TaxID=10129 RepID=UPI00224439D6|nr:UL16-binding protein 1-like [Apodemus sylvaticus]
MEPVAATKVLFCRLALPCCLTLLSVCLCSGREESASLCYSFKVERSNGQWRNEVHGLLNRQKIFVYKDYQCHPIDDHRNRTNATKFCEKEADTLKNEVDIFKAMLSDILETTPINGTEAHVLQARMCCQYEGGKRFRGSWVFRLNGRNICHVDPDTGIWTELDPRYKKIVDKWKKDRDRAAFLDKTSQGDCRTCLDELTSHWKENPEPTGSPIKTSDITQPTCTTQNLPTRNSTKATASIQIQPTRNLQSQNMPGVILVIAEMFVLLLLL